MQGSGWKIVASFEGNFPKRIQQLPLDRHFDISNVKRVCTLVSLILIVCNFAFALQCVVVFVTFTVTPLHLFQIVLEADGYQPYLISPEKGLRSLIKIVLELAKEPARLCVDEVSYAIS